MAGKRLSALSWVESHGDSERRVSCVEWEDPVGIQVWALSSRRGILLLRWENSAWTWE